MEVCLWVCLKETPNDNRKINFSNNHDGSATKKRLQKKLQEKKEGKVDVNKKIKNNI